ncbi:MAG TPA: DUF5752 family protein [Candidatus Nanoarchaeia archaeon]|nr:DUF5752 family protein [Candidatus Nanoarchaeia archaeon]
MVKKRANAVKSALENTISRNSDKNSKARSEPKSSVEIIIKKKILGQAPVENHFVVADGKKLGSVLDLADALETMSEDVFSHHVNDLKNDFSKWVKDVFYDHSLAEDLSRAKTKAESQIAILRRVVKELL